MRVLFISGDCIYPPDSGGRLRTFHLLKRLSQRHQITVVAPITKGINVEDAFDHALERVIMIPALPRTFWRKVRALLSSRPFNVCMRDYPATQAAVEGELTANHFDLMHCEMMAGTPPAFLNSAVPRVYGSQNVEAIIWERYVHEEHKLWILPLVRSQLAKVIAYESSLLRFFDHCAVVSDHDREQMRLRYGAENVSVVLNGVDLEFHTPLPNPLTPTLAFIGSMDWRPNQDAVRWFIESIWPLILAEAPEVSMSVVGARPPGWVVDICKRAGISVHADVPDVRPYLAQAAVIVVPLRIGGGSRLKILEAMAAERCVVSTTVGAEGLVVRDGEHLLIRDDPREFAQAVVSLLRDPSRRQQIARTGRCVVEDGYSWDQIAVQMEEAWHKACAHARQPNAN